MKKLFLTAAFCAGMGQAVSADGASEAMMEPTIIEAEAAASSIGAQTVVILSALLVLAAAASH